MSRLVAIACLFLGAACTPPPASIGAASHPVPPNSAQTCTNYCQSIGLPLASVVIMAENVGCVCNAQPAPPAGAPASTSTSSGAAAGGLAAIMIQQAAASAAAQNQQRQQHH